MAESQQKEYKVIVTDKTSAIQIEETLNALAKDNWQVISSYNVKNGVSPSFEKILIIMERNAA